MGFRWRWARLGLGLGPRAQGLARANTMLWGALLLLGASSLAREAGCPPVCECPEPPACRPGVPLIWDGCGCCQVCAGQFNQMCSALRPCGLGLHCQRAAGSGGVRGVCRASTPGRPCTKNGKVYQHGETFRPSCRLQCTCKDGQIGCLALCPLHLPTPPDHCPDAHLVQVDGTCCKKWKCTTGYSKDWARRDGKRKGTSDSANKVVEHGVAAKRSRGHSKGRSSQDPGCADKGTEWTPCSKTCGFGTSTRQSNNNTRCQLKEEKRLCQTRPCAMLDDLAPKEGSSCLKTHKEKVPRRFTYEGCTSLKRYKPKYCGLCRDGRCCQPSETRTIKVRFQCPGVGTFVIPVAKIKRCECSRQSEGCAQLPPVSYNWKRSLQDLVEPQ